ncbi:MAG: histidinol-phosphate transaminase [Gammaproteobacteria bacterium]|nr:histidinol-phosphate transaminase [Gammaproteobacteria bacterium]
MAKSFLSLAASGVQQLRPYLPGKPVEELERELGITGSIKLASNENPLGPSTKAVDAIREYAESVNFYPDGGGFKLSARLAKKFKVDPACVTLGNGSNDILELVARAFLTPETSAVFSEYSFAVYPIVVQAVGAKANVAKAFPLEHQAMPLGHNPETFLASVDKKTRVAFIANPNNPTGTWLEPQVLKQLLNDLPDEVIIVLDMAYNEYMDESLQIEASKWLADHPNLVITGTFSKIYALAGLRIGYSLSNPEIADLLNRVRQPFNTNLLAQEAALASLDDDEHIKKSVILNDQGKAYFQKSFDDLGLDYLPTMGNFIAVNLRRDGQTVYDDLLRKGVIVRPIGNYNMPEFLRITIGTEEQNKRFIETLIEVLA